MASLRSNAASQVIAIAGGTGGVGSHVVEELLRMDKFEVVLLLRKENPTFLGSLKAQFPASEKLHFSVVAYSDPSSLVDAFTKHSVDTVISVLFDRDAEQMRQSQRNLLVAAEQVASVRRFSPSDWADGLETGINDLISKAYEAKYDIVPLLRNSPLNWMGFSTGIFMDYFASEAPSRRVVGGETRPPTGHLRPLKFIADIENAKATIPIPDDSKESSVVFTRIEDVGKFVAHACLLDNVAWKEGQGKMIGWRGTYTDACKIAESVLGKPFDITYATISELEKGIDPTGAPRASFFVEAQVGIAKGLCDWEEDVLGATLRSQGLGFTPWSVEESIKEWWRS